MQVIVVGGKFALVSDCDFEPLSQYRWHLGHGRARRSIWIGYATTRQMHQDILSAPKGMEIDHIDGNPLNNQRENLRIVTRSQNQANTKKSRGITSRFKGVYFRPSRWPNGASAWVANVQYGGKRITKRFSEEMDAARWYDETAKRVFGEYAHGNFPDAARAAQEENKP